MTGCVRAALAGLLALLLALGQAGWPAASVSALPGMFGPDDICSAHQADGAPAAAKHQAPCCRGHCCHVPTMFTDAGHTFTGPVAADAVPLAVPSASPVVSAGVEAHPARGPPART